MFNRLPVEVNPFRLVEQRKSVVGALTLSQFPRLQELLCSDHDEGVEVYVTLSFERTATGFPSINGEIETRLDLSCQRCLSKLAYSIKSPVNVVLVVTDEQAERRIQEGYESYLVEDERLFLVDFIEDEILLGLPLSPMHEICEAERPYIEALPEDELDVTEEKKQDNPFSALKNLKDLE